MNKEDIQNLIKEILDKVKVSVTEVVVVEESPKKTWFAVEVSEPHLFTERDGEALRALNYLVRRITEKNLTPNPLLKGEGGPFPFQGKAGDEVEQSFIIDINNFEKKRIEGIRTVAHMMAERARYFKSSVEIDPMSPFERRIVHEFLADAADLKTESQGLGRSRRVVIKYVGNN